MTHRWPLRWTAFRIIPGSNGSLLACRLASERKIKTESGILYWLEKKLKIRKPEDWNKVRRADLQENFGSGVLAMYRSVEMLLKKSDRTKVINSGTRR